MKKKNLKQGQKVLFKNGDVAEVAHFLGSKAMVSRNLSDVLYVIPFSSYDENMRLADDNDFSVRDAVRVQHCTADNKLLKEHLKSLLIGEIESIEFYLDAWNYTDIEDKTGFATDPTDAWNMTIINVADGTYVAVANYGGGACITFCASDSANDIMNDIHDAIDDEMLIEI